MKSKPACQDCVRLLNQGLELIDGLSNDQYRCDVPGKACRSTGAHIRHVLDYFDCLLAGLGARAVDYTDRKRRGEVETDREAALAELARCSLELEQRASEFDATEPLRVLADAGEDWCLSTIGRELRFVAGHTIHHYALIRVTLESLGVAAPETYGLSASTLDHAQRARTARTTHPFQNTPNESHAES